MQTYIFRRRKKYPVKLLVMYFMLIAVLVAVDQAVKMLILNKYKYADLPLIGDFVRLSYAENTGAAFSKFQGQMPLLITATIIMVGVCVFLLVARKLEGKAGNIALALICAGGIGNLIDRISRGYVIDYIYPKFINFAIFNIADSCVVIGAILLCIYLLVHEKNAQNKIGIK
jgi:signal peptidase II